MAGTNIVIKSIVLNNFMCHTNLKLTFNAPITIIGGFNGSGKSAIMIAIGIVLGQRTNTLDRGASAKALIQTGKNCAKIQLKISNAQRLLDYKFFGDSIVIEKTLKRDGIYTLRIKSESGKTYSTKKEDLYHIIDCFKLYIDNPLNFLTQENSKKFLKITNAETMYSLFMQGTNLDDTTELHEESNKKTVEMKTRLDLLNEELAEVDSKIKKKKYDLNVVIDANKMDEEIAKLTAEIEWSKLEESMNEIRIKKQEIDALASEIDNLDQEISKNNQKITDMKEDEEKKETEMKRIKKALCEKKKKLELEIRSYELDEREMKGDLEDLVRNYNDNMQRLEKLKKIEGADTIKEKRRLFEKKTALKKEYSDKLNDLNAEMEKEVEKNKNNKIKLTGLQQSKFNITKQIEFLKKINENKLLFFHSKIKEILDTIHNTKFEDDVIGPIGNYINLKDFKWNKAISIILQHTLNNFIVFNKHDKVKLKKIFDKYDANFSILVPSFKKNILINYDKIQDYKFAIDVVEICHPMKNIILNQLIILNSLESIILVDDRSLAYSILRNENRTKRRFPITTAYTEDGDRIRMKANALSDFRTRTHSFYFEQNTSKLKILMSEYERIAAEIKNLTIPDNTIVIQEKIDKINQLMAQNERDLSNLELETSMDIAGNIKEELETMEKTVENLKTQKEELENNLKKIMNLRLKAYKEMKECDNISVPTSNHNVANSIQGLFIDNNILEKKIHNIQIKLNKKKEEVTTLMNYYEIKYNDLKCKNNNEINQPRSILFLQKKIKECEFKKEMCLNLDNEETLKNDLSELNNMYKHKKKLVGNYERQISRIAKNIKLRIQKRERLKLEMAEQIAEKFKALTAKRKYDGILEFDHEKKLLDLKMKVNIKASDKSMLSGGERSFASMCLILSMWSSISCPIKILDEFDVFMDSLNRSTIMQELVDLFNESGLQIILITPLSTRVKNVDFIMLEHPNRQ